MYIFVLIQTNLAKLVWKIGPLAYILQIFSLKYFYSLVRNDHKMQEI